MVKSVDVTPRYEGGSAIESRGLISEGVTQEQKRAQVERIRNSAALQNSPMLQKLLEFVASRAGEDGPEISEYVVAAEVFGRSGGFDPAGDTTVRTAFYRLRAKLREYYAGEGKGDEVVVEIPKGRYTLQFSRPGEGAAEVDAVPAPATAAALRKPAPGLLAAGALVLFATGLAVGWTWPKSKPAEISSALATFWRGFAAGDNSVVAAFANVEMLHTDSGDLLKFEGGAVDDRGAKVDRPVAERAVASPELLGKHELFYEDGYSGTGEVHAVNHLSRLLARIGVELQVKRSRLVASYDLKNHNLILLGAGRENLAVEGLHLKQGYVFDTPSHAMWSNRIVDASGGRGGYAIKRDPASGALKTDYALFSVMPGIAPGRKIIMLAGLTTSGTQGAAEFATSEAQMAALLGMMKRKTLPRYFECVLEVQVVRGLDPVAIRCVAAREIAVE